MVYCYPPQSTRRGCSRVVVTLASFDTVFMRFVRDFLGVGVLVGAFASAKVSSEYAMRVSWQAMLSRAMRSRSFCRSFICEGEWLVFRGGL